MNAKRGFAAMTPEKQRQIASQGGKASHRSGTGHEWNSETARIAGSKGGKASRGGRGKRVVETPTESAAPATPESTSAPTVSAPTE